MSGLCFMTVESFFMNRAATVVWVLRGEGGIIYGSLYAGEMNNRCKVFSSNGEGNSFTVGIKIHLV